jgi:flavin-binding protein dodecin
VDNAVEEASKTLSGLKWVEVKNLRGHVAEGKLVEYEATVIIGFEVKAER